MAAKSKNISMTPRQRRKYRIRKNISGTESCPRLSVFRSLKHTYAQVVSDVTGKTLIGVSTKDKEVLGAVSSVNTDDIHSESKSSKSITASKALGTVLAKKCEEKGISSVVFDRNGFLYHGRVQAVADGAREGGLKF